MNHRSIAGIRYSQELGVHANMSRRRTTPEDDTAIVSKYPGSGAAQQP